MSKRYLMYLICAIIIIISLVIINTINNHDAFLKTVKNEKFESQEMKNNCEIFNIEDFFSKKQSFKFAELPLYPKEIIIHSKYGKPQISHSGEYYEDRAYTSEDSIISYYGISLNTVETLIVSNKYLGISLKGIKIGSTEKELFAAYSFPKYKMEKAEKVVYYYGDNGHYFIFEMENNVVQGMGWISHADNEYFDMILDEGRIKRYIH